MKIIDKLREDGLIESEKAKPSSDPAYWAKRSCTTCHGRGVQGTADGAGRGVPIRNQIVCYCAQRNFTKWRDAWIAEYIAKHSV